MCLSSLRAQEDLKDAAEQLKDAGELFNDAEVKMRPVQDAVNEVDLQLRYGFIKEVRTLQGSSSIHGHMSSHYLLPSTLGTAARSRAPHSRFGFNGPRLHDPSGLP